MNKRIASHTPFLKFILVIIGTWILVMAGLYSYSEYQRVRHLLNFYRHQSETKAYESLEKMINYYAKNPREMDEDVTENSHYQLKKVSAAGSPNDTWHMIGWQEADDGETYRLERCFAVPAATDKKSN